MKLKRNLYAMVGMAAWKYGKPYMKKKLAHRKQRDSGGRALTGSAHAG